MLGLPQALQWINVERTNSYKVLLHESIHKVCKIKVHSKHGNDTTVGLQIKVGSIWMLCVAAHAVISIHQPDIVVHQFLQTTMIHKCCTDLVTGKS